VAQPSINDWQSVSAPTGLHLLSNHATALLLAQDTAHPTGTYLHIIMKVRKNNSPEIVSMTEVQGTLPSRDEAASRVALIVNENNQPTSVEFLPEDPLLIRGFEDPGNRKGEFIAQSDFATIAIDIPNDIGEAASGTVSLELSRVQRFASGTIHQTSGEASLVQQLKSDNVLKRESRLSGSQLKSAATDVSKTKSMP